ncbi:MAG: Shikimate kinase 1 [Firmicutes bacterium]|nr:Shikimate kinase 1 [candidate division NPL-UPA2 bacterium]
MIVLMGMMGSGKSSVGRMLTRRLNLVAIDLDREIERRVGLTVAEIFALHGEAYFRILEEEALLRLAETGRPMILSLGGGAVLAQRGMEALKTKATAVIYLKASVPQLLMRLKHSRVKRPLLENTADPSGRLRELLAVRRPLYERYADFTVDTNGKLLSAVAEEIYDLVRPRLSARGRD